MNLYPAIDIYKGKVVRLTRGDFNSCTVYSENPAAQAMEWERQGARWVHVVDLEGARTGGMTSGNSLAAICRTVKAKIQFGGGLRDINDIKKVLALGVSRVVLGTKALDKSFLLEALAKFGDKIAVGLDVHKNRVKISGWEQEGLVTLTEALYLFNGLGAPVLIYTDIERDGVLQGPNWETLSFVLANTKAKVILSGGIGGLADIEKCRGIEESNFEGVIIGKALYSKRFQLREAVEQQVEGGL